MQLDILTKAFNESWARDTCYSKVIDEWSVNNKSLGQCAITCLIVNDYFDFDIYKCKVNGISHYFNMKDNEIIDLTKEQFNNTTFEYENIRKATREEILSNNDTQKRYILLKNRLSNKLQ